MLFVYSWVNYWFRLARPDFRLGEDELRLGGVNTGFGGLGGEETVGVKWFGVNTDPLRVLDTGGFRVNGNWSEVNWG